MNNTKLKYSNLKNNALKNNKVVPIYYNQDPELVLSIIKACHTAGIKVFEFVNRGTNSIEVMKVIKPFCVQNDILLGVGSILNSKATEIFCELGADFLVSPGFDKQVLEVASAKGITYIPGVATPTEILNAHSELTNKGYEEVFLKLFPAKYIGADWLKAVTAPLQTLEPKISFMATGGIGKNNIKEWIEAGCVAVGMGSELFDKEKVASGDWDGVVEGLKRVVEG